MAPRKKQYYVRPDQPSNLSLGKDFGRSAEDVLKPGDPVELTDAEVDKLRERGLSNMLCTELPEPPPKVKGLDDPEDDDPDADPEDDDPDADPTE